MFRRVLSQSTAVVIVTIPLSNPNAPLIVPTLSNSKQHHLCNKPKDDARFNAQGFFNPWPSMIENPAVFSLLGAKALYGVWKDWTPFPTPSREELPTVRDPRDDNYGRGATFTSEEDDKWKTELKSTWLGHACMLVEYPAEGSTASRGARVLFDPVFSNRCSPVQFMGPARVTPTPLDVTQLPAVDCVVISHSHYDHMDLSTLTALYKAQPKDSLHFFAPLGNKAWFISNGFAEEHVHELDWWEERKVDIELDEKNRTSIVLTCTPAQHFSGRTLTDRCVTLWASWSASHTSTTGVRSSFWFGGDTGYRSLPAGTTDASTLPSCPAFKEIGERLGPFDLSAIPIGAYAPTRAFSAVHASPEDAVDIHCDVKSKKSIGIHWGTFRLTCEEMTEPPKRLKSAVEAKKLPESEFGVCSIGETVRVSVG